MIFGGLIGGKKLCPKISPKKTISGAIAGLFGGMIGGLAVYAIFGAIFPAIFAITTYWQFLLVSFIVSVIAELGDLFESFSKRRAGVKDSGDIFRSHGGALDRLDSVVALLLIF